jgi:hypothetical protein
MREREIENNVDGCSRAGVAVVDGDRKVHDMMQSS